MEMIASLSIQEYTGVGVMEDHINGAEEGQVSTLPLQFGLHADMHMPTGIDTLM
jgi:hypothetical protein